MLEEYVRKSDFYLRTQFPHLNTKIFKMENGFYEIFVENPPEDFNSFSQKFNYSIKIITAPVILSKTLPINYKSEIKPISDSNIINDFKGIPLTNWQLQRLLSSKFQNIITEYCEYNNGQAINIYTRKIQDEKLKLEYENFINNLGYNIKVNFFYEDDIIEKKLDENIKREKEFCISNPNLNEFKNQINNPIFNMLPLSQIKNHIEAEEKDEEFWFSKINDVFNGNIQKKDIVHNTSLHNCFIDYASSYYKNVNIRNGLLLFNTTYIDLPFDESIKTFCDDEKITIDELLYLSKTNRIKFVLSQPSFRYDRAFLSDVYRLNPNAIITRRRLSALIIADLVEINKHYFLNEIIPLRDNIYDFIKLVSEKNNINENSLYSILTWPQRALKESFETLLFGSPQKSAIFGINKTFEELLVNSKITNPDISFEFTFNAEKVHTSSALNSFYFPYYEKKGDYSNQLSTSLMADRLNFYKNASINLIKPFLQCRDNILKNKQTIAPINLIEVNDFISLRDIDSISKIFFTPEQFSSIFSYLDSLSDIERINKIQEYNKLIDEKHKKHGIIGVGADFTINAGLDAIGIFCPFPFLGTAVGVGKTILQKTHTLDKIQQKYEEKIGLISSPQNEENKIISFLAKVNPVAKFKTFN